MCEFCIAFVNRLRFKEDEFQNFQTIENFTSKASFELRFARNRPTTSLCPNIGMLSLIQYTRYAPDMGTKFVQICRQSLVKSPFSQAILLV